MRRFHNARQGLSPVETVPKTSYAEKLDQLVVSMTPEKASSPPISPTKVLISSYASLAHLNRLMPACTTEKWKNFNVGGPWKLPVPVLFSFSLPRSSYPQINF